MHAQSLGQDSVIHKADPHLYDPLKGMAHAGGLQVDDGKGEWEHVGLVRKSI